MSKETNIEWADSSLNLQMGCDGCELWNPAAEVKHCYAGTLTERYAGVNKGFPKSFDEPMIFRERIMQIKNWKSLTGMMRLNKPWLNGLPRIIFLNDMGDTFTESLPLDWLAEKFGEKDQSLLDMMERSQDQYLLLTKRPRRMVEFSRWYPLPKNVWPGTSITSQANIGRVRDLMEVKGGGPLWLSVEPLLGPVMIPEVWQSRINWIIVGGESGKDARPMKPEWARNIREQCRMSATAFFMKQMDKKEPIPDDLMIRQMPSFPVIVPEKQTLDLSKASCWVAGMGAVMHRGSTLFDPKGLIKVITTVNCHPTDVTIIRKNTEKDNVILN